MRASGDSQRPGGGGPFSSFFQSSSHVAFKHAEWRKVAARAMNRTRYGTRSSNSIGYVEESLVCQGVAAIERYYSCFVVLPLDHNKSVTDSRLRVHRNRRQLLPCVRGVGGETVQWPLRSERPCIPPSRILERFTARRMKREEKLVLFLRPEDSVRLRMLAYCLKIHHVRFVACLNALPPTQAWQGRFSRASIRFCISISYARLFSIEPRSFLAR